MDQVNIKYIESKYFTLLSNKLKIQMLLQNTDDLPVDKTAKNIRFLRKSIDVTLQDLADFIEIDPINLYQYEKDDYQVEFENGCGDHIDLANYFAIKLNKLLYNDVEEEKLLDKSWFQQLKDEKNLGHTATRKKFRKEVLEGEGEINGVSSTED